MKVHPDTDRRLRTYHLAVQLLEVETGRAVRRHDAATDGAALAAATGGTPTAEHITALVMAGSWLSDIVKIYTVARAALEKAAITANEHRNTDTDALAHYATAGTAARDDDDVGAVKLLHAFMRGDLLERGTYGKDAPADSLAKVQDDFTWAANDGGSESLSLSHKEGRYTAISELAKAMSAHVPRTTPDDMVPPQIRKRMGGLN